MISLVFTMLPIALTFTVAAWSSPTAEVQPRSALPGSSPNTPCRC